MKKPIKSTIIFSVFLFTCLSLSAIPADPTPKKIIQPDGTELTIQLKGDEFFRYKTTVDGHLILKNDKGIFTYAIQDESGKFKSSDVKVKDVDKRTAKEKKFIKTLPQKIDFKSLKSGMRKISAEADTTYVPQKVFPSTGTNRTLVILVNFSDKSFVTPNPQTAFTNLLNEEGYSANYASGSARDYFEASSNGILSPQFDVVGPFTLPQKMAYYGENDASGNDKNPRQMVIDACTLANANGVDFTQYDTDNDGKVDNIFVYYAGYNEAENATDDTIWPHRWILANYSTIFDGKIIFDYACASELRGYVGTTMCGVGTFCHEFGHVLGLVDLYPTDGGTHHTLSYFDIMDQGAYNNNGRTPPLYSSYERFYLNWLTPIELKQPQKVTLDALSASNKAYLISQYGNHNLDGDNPNPLEFFMIENRQKTGWDTYIPYHGMLITRIYYNSTTWHNNAPNNIEDQMGIDLMEADEDASKYSLSGDPFPGTSAVTSYSPVLRSEINITGTNINKPLTSIKEENGIISFWFMKGPKISVDANLNTFNITYGIPSAYQTLKVYGEDLISDITIRFKSNAHFEIKKETDISWGKTISLPPVDSIVDTTTILIRYNPIEPSIATSHLDTISFGADDAQPKTVAIEGKSACPEDDLATPVALDATDVKSITFVANWESVVDDVTGYYISVYSLADEKDTITEGFDNGLEAPVGWTITADDTTSTDLYSGQSVPAIMFNEDGEYIQTEEYILPASELSFFAKSNAAKNGYLIVEGRNNTVWEVIDSIPVTTSLGLNAETKTYTFSTDKNYIQFRITNTFDSISGYVAVDDISPVFEKKISLAESNKWVDASSSNIISDTIINVIPNTAYNYQVKSIKTVNYTCGECIYISDFSDLVSAQTLIDETPSVLKYTHSDNGDGTVNVRVTLPNASVTLYVYNALGQLMIQKTENKNVVSISLPKNQLYILKAGNQLVKVIL